MIKFILICILTMPVFTALFAQENYTLKKLTEIALQNSEIIQARQWERKSFDGAIQQAGAWQNPDFSADLGSRTIGTENGIGYSFNISQPFYFPGKQQIRGDIQRNLQNAANISLEETRRYVFRRVIALSFYYNEASHHTEYLEKRRQRFKIIEQYMSNRPFVSPQKKLEKTIVENKILLLEKEILDVKNERKTIWEELNIYLGFDTPVDIQARWFSRGVELKNDILLNALKQNPELAMQDNALHRTELQKSLASKEALPDFSLSAIYSEDRTSYVERFIGGGITFYLPLWNQNKGLVAQHEAEISSLQALKTFTDKKNRAALNTLLINYENKRSLIQKYPMAMIEKIHEQAEYAAFVFQKGQVDMLTYLETEQGLFEVHTAIFKSQLDYVDSYLKILELTASMDFQEEN